MNKEKFFSYFLLGLTALFIVVLAYMLQWFIKPIIWALIFALIAYPIHIWMTRLIRYRTVSALIIATFVFLIIVIPTFVIGFLVVQEAFNLTYYVVQFMQNHDYVNLTQDLIKKPWIEKRIGKENIDNLLNYIQSDSFKNHIFSFFSELLKRLGETTTAMIINTGNVIFKTFIFLLTFFFILRDGYKFFEFVKELIPMEIEDIVKISTTVYKTVLSVVYGSIFIAIAQGVASFVAYVIIGYKYSLLLAFVTFVASFIPPFGASFIWVPVAIYTFFKLGVYKGIFMILYGTLIISMMDNILRPLFMKKDVNLPYIALFFSILGGLYTFGFIGLFLGPILFTTTVTLLSIYKKRLLS